MPRLGYNHDSHLSHLATFLLPYSPGANRGIVYFVLLLLIESNIYYRLS